MKLRLALGVGALALLIVGLVGWDGFDRPTLSGHILIVGPTGLPPLAGGEDDVGAFSLCVPRGGTLFVHVLPFTRMLDARGRLFTTTTNVGALQPGQRIQIWTTDEPITFGPPQISAVKIKITGNAIAGEDVGTCEISVSPPHPRTFGAGANTPAAIAAIIISIASPSAPAQATNTNDGPSAS